MNDLQCPGKAKTVAALEFCWSLKLRKDASRQQPCFWVSLGCLSARFRQARLEYQRQKVEGKTMAFLLITYRFFLSELTQLRIDDGASYVLPMHSDGLTLMEVMMAIMANFAIVPSMDPPHHPLTAHWRSERKMKAIFHCCGVPSAKLARWVVTVVQVAKRIPSHLKAEVSWCYINVFGDHIKNFSNFHGLIWRKAWQNRVRRHYNVELFQRYCRAPVAIASLVQVWVFAVALALSLVNKWRKIADGRHKLLGHDSLTWWIRCVFPDSSGWGADSTEQIRICRWLTDMPKSLRRTVKSSAQGPQGANKNMKEPAGRRIDFCSVKHSVATGSQCKLWTAFRMDTVFRYLDWCQNLFTGIQHAISKKQKLHPLGFWHSFGGRLVHSAPWNPLASNISSFTRMNLWPFQYRHWFKFPISGISTRQIPVSSKQELHHAAASSPNARCTLRCCRLQSRWAFRSLCWHASCTAPRGGSDWVFGHEQLWVGPDFQQISAGKIRGVAFTSLCCLQTHTLKQFSRKSGLKVYHGLRCVYYIDQKNHESSMQMSPHKKESDVVPP